MSSSKQNPSEHQPDSGSTCIEWVLQGEGNKNLVFAYKGGDLLLRGTVLRVCKPWTTTVKHADKKQVWSPDQLKAVKQLEEEIWAGLSGPDRGRAFIAECLKPLLGAAYVHAGLPVYIPDSVAQQLTQLMQKQVPAGDEVPAVTPDSVQAILMPDHSVFAQGPPAGYQAVGPVVSVEVKPKSGVLPRSPHLSSTTAELKHKYPRFVMHSLLKQTKGKGQACAYDPRDLFSREPQRVRHALDTLLATPNNNLRVFIHGKLVFGGRPEAASTDSDVYRQGAGDKTDAGTLAQALAAAGWGSDRAGSSGVEAVQDGAPIPSNVTTLLEVLAKLLCQEDCLGRLQAVQDLDGLDPEGAEPLLSAMLAVQSKHQQQGVDRSQISASESTKAASGAGDSTKVWESYDWAGACTALRDYLTSMTAKDCSVMITLQQLQPTSAVAASEQLRQQASGQEGAGHEKEGAGAVHGMYADEVSTAVPLAAAAAQLAEERKAGPWPAVVGLTDESAFMYQVALLDLDVKPLAKIPVHAALDKEVVECASRNLALLEQLTSASK